MSPMSTPRGAGPARRAAAALLTAAALPAVGGVPAAAVPVVLPGLCLAYIDPMSGTLLTQMIIAAVIGVVAWFRAPFVAMSRRVRRLFGRGSGESAD